MSTALGALAGVFWILAAQAYVAGWQIDALGCRPGAIGTWVGAGIFFVAGAVVLCYFRRRYEFEKMGEITGQVSNTRRNKE